MTYVGEQPEKATAQRRRTAMRNRGLTRVKLKNILRERAD
jgi:hypothetical protein